MIKAFKEVQSKTPQYQAPMAELINIESLNLLLSFSSHGALKDYKDYGEWDVDEDGNPLDELEIDLEFDL